MPFLNGFRLLYTLLTFIIITSCKPVIHSFSVSPPVITGDEKLKIGWRVSGEPSMEFNEHLSVDSIQLIEFTLVVKRGEKEVRQTVQVQKMKAEAAIDITFATNARKGDTVIASGENNNNQWSRFKVVSISSASSRDLVVTHEGHTATIKGDGTLSSTFLNTSAAGEWIFKTLLTDVERADSTKIPEKLMIHAVVKPLNP